MATVVMLTVVDVTPVNGGLSSMSSQNSPLRPYLHMQRYVPDDDVQLVAPSLHGLQCVKHSCNIRWQTFLFFKLGQNRRNRSYFSGPETLCNISSKSNKNCGRRSDDRHTDIQTDASDFYARQLYRRWERVLAMAILSVCPSVCPSVCHDPVVYQAQVR